MTTMIGNSVTLTGKSSISVLYPRLSRPPISSLRTGTASFLKTPVQIISQRKCSSFTCLHQSNPFNFRESRIDFKDLGCSATGFRKFGSENFRVSAVSGGGSGDGNSGKGGEGGGGNGGGSGSDGSNWSFLSWYLALLEKYPVLTKAVTSAILTFIGDMICQVVIDQAPSLDLKRTFMFTLLGLVLVGPTLHFWYSYLSKLVTMTGASGAALRLLLDQFVFSPIFIGVFLSTLVTLEGKPSQVLPKLQQEWFSAVLANWQLWIPFQFLNFRFVPQQFQVLAANAIALVWNVILSFRAHREVTIK